MNPLGPVPWLKLAVCGAIFAGGLYLGYTLEKGRWNASVVAQERDYQAKLAAALKVSAERQAAVDAATREKDSALQSLVEYRNSHPVHIWVCKQPSPAPAVPTGTGAQPAGAPPAPVFQPVTTDIGPALDSLMAQADTLNENYRVCRAGYRALSGTSP